MIDQAPRTPQVAARLNNEAALHEYGDPHVGGLPEETVDVSSGGAKLDWETRWKPFDCDPKQQALLQQISADIEAAYRDDMHFEEEGTDPKQISRW